MADAKIIISAVDKTKVAFDSIKRSVGSVNGLLAGIGVGVSAGALTAMVKNAIDFADEMGKAAQKVGVTTEALSGLKYAAELSAVSFETLQGGLKKLSVSLFDADRGLKEQSDAFKALGISVKDGSGNLKAADVVLKEMAARFVTMPDGTQKTALAMKLLGKSGAELIPLLNAGADGIAAMTAEAAQFGKIVDSETARAAEQFNDDMTRLKSAATGVGLELAKTLLPGLTEISKAMAEAARESGILTAAWVGLGGAAAFALGQTDRQQNVQRLEEINKQIAAAQKQIAAASLNPEGASDRFFNFLIPDVSLNPEAKASLKRNLDALVKERDRLLKLVTPPPAPKPPAPAGTGGGTGTGGKPVRTSVDQDASAAARFVDQIKRQAEVLGLTKEELIKYEAAHLKLTAAQRSTVDAAIAQIGAFEQQQEAMEKMAEMQKSFDDEATRQAADELADIEQQAAAQEDINQALRDYVANIEKAIDPTIELADNIGKVQSALSLGLISQEDAARLIGYLESVKNETKEVGDELNDVAKDLGLTFTSAFEDAITGAKSFQDILKALEQDIIRIITRKLVTEPLAAGISGMVKDFDFGKIFGSIFGSANGNIMTPGGPLPLGSYAGGGVSGGPSSGYLAMLHGTEAVVPLPDGRNIPVEMKGGGQTVVNMTINTPDANSFRKAQGQMMQDMQSQLNRARRVS